MRAPLAWPDGLTPRSTLFLDSYYDTRDGLAESRHVFLAGNGLPARFRPGFHIAELGFGTGLNMLAALQAWRRGPVPGRLRFTSFEAYPVSGADMRRALSRFPELSQLADPVLRIWESGECAGDLPDMDFEVILGDARDTVPEWSGAADAWFLDGFAPSRNPELWEPALLASVANHTGPEGTFATYSAAGAVRRALSAAGFTVERCQGFGRKRHMCRGMIGRRN